LDVSVIWILYRIYTESSSRMMRKIKVKLGKPVTAQCAENLDRCIRSVAEVCALLSTV